MTQFGFIYNPLFRAVGWNVALFRQIGMVVTVLLSGVLVALWLCRLGLSWKQAVAAGFILAPISLTVFYSWVSTPSYNSLGLQGLLLVGIALSLMGGRQLGYAGRLGNPRAGRLAGLHG